MPHTRPLVSHLLTGLTLLLTLGGVNAQSSGKTLRVFAGVYTPTAATTVTAQTPRVNNALRDLAQKFTQQTGVKVEFVTPGFNVADTDIPENRAKWESFMQAGIASGTAPDITAVPQNWPLLRCPAATRSGALARTCSGPGPLFQTLPNKRPGFACKNLLYTKALWPRWTARTSTPTPSSPSSF